MIPINHPLWFPLRESLGSFPHSLLVAPARQGLWSTQVRLRRGLTMVGPGIETMRRETAPNIPTHGFLGGSQPSGSLAF